MNEITIKLKKILKSLDDEADRIKKNQFLPIWFSGIVCGVVAVFAFAISQAFHVYIHNEWVLLVLASLEFFLIIISFVLLGYFAPKQKK